MSYIANVNIVGELVSDVEIRKTSAGREYLLAFVRTGTPYAGKPQGTTEWFFVTHRVVCFKKKNIELLKQRGKRATWVKVFGELSYFKKDTAQIRVDDDYGNMGLMFNTVFPSDAEMTDEEFQLREAYGGPGGQSEQANASGSASSASQSLDDDEIPF